MKEKENTVPTSRKKKIVSAVILAVCALLLVTAIVLTAYFVTGGSRQVLEEPPISSEDPPTSGDNDPPTSGQEDPPTSGNEDPPTSGGEKVAFIAPLGDVTCSVEYLKIYENTTLDKWYYHKAVDYAAPAGTEVKAMADGQVAKISLSEKLGNLVVLQHADGVQSVYRFVEPIPALKEGAAVKQGEVIAKVAEAYGTEANDGTHLHLEMTQEGKAVDPADYIDVTLEEK